MKTILGIKQNMITRFSPQGFQIPVTIVVAEPNVVLIKGDDHLLLGLGRRKKVKKTENAYVKAAGFTPRFIKQIKILEKSLPAQTSEETQQSQTKLNPGDKVAVTIFEPGDEVKVTGTTKGKGFAGVIKRHGFHGGPKTHGQSDRHRAPGSIGAGTTPGRVYKGKRMAGHMGASQFTVTGLEIIDVDGDKNLLFIKGAIPGSKNGFVIVEKTGKVKGYTPPPPPNEEKQAARESELRSSDERAEKEEKAQEEARLPATEAAGNVGQAKEAKAATSEDTETKVEESKPETIAPSKEEENAK